MSLALLASLSVSACGDAAPIGPPELQAITVEPSPARLASVGDSVRFTATATFSDGSSRTVDPRWSTSVPDMISIDDDGWATALAVGSGVIEASYMEEQGVAALFVNPDTVPPRLVQVFAAASRVTISAGPATVPITAEFIDVGSGVRSALAVFDGPLGAGVTGVVTLSESSREIVGDSVVVSTYTGSLEIPGLVGVGTWKLDVLEAEDGSRNGRRWGSAELERRNLDVEIIASLGSEE